VVLPSGIVSFVFTDIEGSTRMLKRLGDGYAPVLERHQALLRDAWSATAGHEVHTEGDSFFVAFETASSAVAGCATAQRLLGAEPWPELGTVRVRMGIHLGLASPRNDDYVALAVHRAARVMGAAHGGQVLVTEDVATAAGDTSDVTLTSLGLYRLRDFDEPVRLHQVAGAGLADAFPAVRAVPAEGHNLVVPQTTFVGRTEDAARLAALLDAERLVTLTGPGGVGKTRLASEVGVRIADRWTDGLWFVDLADIDDGALVPRAIASAVGVPYGSGSDRWAEVLDHLRTRQLLIVLDNVEHLVDACGACVADLLTTCGGVDVLATGRAPLGIAGEVVVRVAPLPLPDGDPARSSAVELFVDRARAARADAVADDASAVADAAAICRRLDGLPLALEIAAARVGVMSVNEIRRGLDSGFELLRSRERHRPERQRTMETLLSWSYETLSTDEQAALRRLGAFGGGFSIDAACVAVADRDVTADDVPELVWSLVDKSLVVADYTANDTRYRYLETVRHYARTHLAISGETESAVARLVTWFLDRVGPWRPPDGAWASEVGLELANLRSLVLLVAPVDPERAQQLACVVGRYDDVAQRFRAGIEDLARYVDELGAPTPSRVALLTALGDLYLRIGQVDPARRLAAEADALRKEVGPPPWDDAGVERTSGEVAIRTLDLARATAIAEEALARPLSPRGRARMWNLRGIASYRAGDLDGAADAFDAELAALLELGHEVFVASAHGNCAEIAMQRGRVAEAAAHQLACLEPALALGQPVQLAFSLIVAARLAATQARWPIATRLQAKADAILGEVGHVLYEDDRRLSDQLLADARAKLGPSTFDQERARGLALDPSAAGELAAEVLRAVSAPSRV